MSIQEQDWNVELNHLNQIKEEIDRQLEQLEAVVRERKSEVVSIRRHFWDEITVNTNYFDEIAETAASITQQRAVLTQQERSYQLAQNTLRNLEKLQHTPYFARINFKEKGTEQPEHIYIGVGSLIDEHSHELLVYDWRAPIAGMFYDYMPGPAQYLTPDGIIQGEITLKRQYVIKNGKLENMFDTGISIGDEMLQYMLAKNVQDKMSSIVTTIQQEQNRIIRDHTHQILIVQGAAGSGKTSVALQRVAYLLYEYRTSLNPENMVLFSPNSLFNDYVSNVLPELGETNIQQTTFQEHLARELNQGFVVEDAYDQLEYLLTTSESTPEYKDRVKSIEWKTSLQFMHVLDNYIDELKQRGLSFKAFILRGKTLISSEQLTDLFYHEYGHISSLSNRMKSVQKWVLQKLAMLEERLFQNAYQKMIKSTKYLGTDKEMKEESRRKARKAFASLQSMARNWGFIDFMKLYRRLLASAEQGKFLEKRLNQNLLPYEDATPFLYFKQAFMGVRTFQTVKHIIIDEAQDYSPFQVAYIRRIFPKARFTILGDLNQGVYYANVQSYDRIGQLFEKDEIGLVRLSKSYRSTSEIIEFTRHILLSPEPIEAIGRTGEPPMIAGVSSDAQLLDGIIDSIQDLRQKGSASIAVICKTEQEAKQAFADLQGKMSQPIHLVSKQTRTFVKGLIVVPAYLAKGLEFDSVIVYNASKDNYNYESVRKLLYTACTRALHHLHIYHTGELTPFIKQ